MCKDENDWDIVDALKLTQRGIFSKKLDIYCYVTSKFDSLMQNRKRKFELYQNNDTPMCLIFHA